jgi:hypothetical protein
MQAQPQFFRCINGTTTYFSDRPCQAALPRTLVPAAPPPAPTTLPLPSKAAEALPYMSPECAQINEGLRTGAQRGLKPAAMAELMSEYKQRCVEDEQRATQKLSQVKGSEGAVREQTIAQRKAEEDRAASTVEQCRELSRILVSKRQRLPSMGPGERGDLERFEAGYKSRCLGG